MTISHTVSADDIRASFAASLSDMYQQEVPQYGTLLDIVSTINRQSGGFQCGDEGVSQRVEVERHGAIRLGTAEELSMMRRLFAVMGMEPVSYYDLTIAGLPIYATGFRPLREDSLQRNPFRVFTSLLRLELIQDEALRARASDILSKRRIFTRRCIELIEVFEGSSTITEEAAQEFIREALETFRWHRTSTVDLATYKALYAQHALVADIVCFRGPHINHLTPRVFDIDAAQAAMISRGLQAKASIEGPPPRHVPILLRQTSFLALEEEIVFLGGVEKGGKHRARFGEIEQRGIALTPKGRNLYDRLLDRFCQTIAEPSSKGTRSDKQALLMEAFREFPDDLETIREEGLGYFKYEVSETAQGASESKDINELVSSGHLKFRPIVYEDFLPASAAGIFHSNLRGEYGTKKSGTSDQTKFEKALGCSVHDEFDLYAGIEQSSLSECLKRLSS